MIYLSDFETESTVNGSDSSRFRIIIEVDVSGTDEARMYDAVKNRDVKQVAKILGEME